jgi:lysyl endopeptidase
MNNRFLLLNLCFLANIMCLNAQIQTGGMPLSLQNNPPISLATAPILKLPLPNLEAVRFEDATQPIGQIRFAVPVPIAFNLQNSGTWTTLPTGDRVWTLKIQSTGALGIAIAYQNFYLPPGSQLYMYRPDGKQILGGYTDANNSPQNVFLTGIINGDSAILEYFEPENALGKGHFELSTLYYAYRNPNPTDDILGFNDAQPCHVNINCPEGADFATNKRAITRIRMVMNEGMGWCSGSMIANTASDGKPYLLSAYHCQDGFTPLHALWTFYFGYESPDCNNPAQAPRTNSLQGCVQRAGWRNTDFLLLELNSRIPNHFNGYFNGWNRDSINLPARTAMIHHPQGDLQKISMDHQPATLQTTPVNWNNNVITPANHHLKVHFDVGTTEIGSSGAPLLDAQYRIVGQLNGVLNQNANPCLNVGDALCGRLSKSWNGGGTSQNRLKDWLDPLNTNVLTLGGIAAPLFRARVSGYVRGYWGQGIADVTLSLSNSTTAVTDTSGFFQFEDVPINTPLQLQLVKTDNILLNGISIADITPISRHILGIEALDTPRELAADLNFDHDVNAADMIAIRRMVLRIANNYPANVSGWGFADEIFLGINQFSVNFTGNVSNLNFIAFKRGDTNGSADGYR